MPMDTPYWNPRTETLPREQLDALQSAQAARPRRLDARRTPRGRAERLREAGVRAEDISSLDDVRRIPFMTRDEWMESQIADPPFGAVLAAAARGGDPLPHDLRHDAAAARSRCSTARRTGSGSRRCGATRCGASASAPRDTLFFAFSYATFVGFWGAHYAAEKLGCLVLPGGNMTTDARVRQIVEMGATVVCSTPTYALRMAQEAQALGIDLAGGPVRRADPSGEPAGSIPATKRLIEEQWGAKAADTAGMTELGTIMMFECDHQPGGTHIIEDHYLEEVLDPDDRRAGGLRRGWASGSSPPSAAASSPCCATGRGTSCAACPRRRAPAGGPSTSTTAASAGASTT